MSLDATAVLFTPVVIGVVRARHAASAPSLLVTTQLANAGSSLLPISNLTNLLVFSATGLSFGGFAVRMALPTAAAAAVVVGTVVVDTPHAALAPLERPRSTALDWLRHTRDGRDRGAHGGVLRQLPARGRARVDRGGRRGRACRRRDRERPGATVGGRARDVAHIPGVRPRPRGGGGGGGRSRVARPRGRRSARRRWPARAARDGGARGRARQPGEQRACDPCARLGGARRVDRACCSRCSSA